MLTDRCALQVPQPLPEDATESSPCPEPLLGPILRFLRRHHYSLPMYYPARGPPSAGEAAATGPGDADSPAP